MPDAGYATRPLAPESWQPYADLVDRHHRRKGVAARALEGAMPLIAEAGCGTVGACPEELTGQKTSAGFLWGGTLSLFERAGFAPHRKIGKHRWIVRRNIERTLQ
ncbi:hypothetical protein [Pelagovum pacificum]|uniref:GNAT family N-acetyltransferase n=1 Tax=Pelagovum pacificum TaxID=2588711 RepID=A0A5C5GI45_9RHOB|nr:hypothetical protein [Pelagovum pacificum]QQA43754.1 hypothetical protein I8N54_04030 [Pelagovum pacificum]TNY33116.1 hypothetical protein FHY64_07505 [Pelagovum pacificum]